jgi:RNA 2',3'-cyclic 3'-phosphodiesterase
MRTFVAIDIPSNIHASIHELIESLKKADPNVRWARSDGLHITLKFLGEVLPFKVELVKKSLASVHFPAPFPVAIEGSGYFPNARSPRVIWLGIEGGVELRELASRIEQALEPLGFEREKREFSPHLTLGRLDAPRKLAAVEERLQGRQPLALGSFTANEFFLYESKPSSRGSVYTKIARFGISPGAS